MALKQCEESIVLLKTLGEQDMEAGIASQNLIEELLENLLRVKDKDLDVIEEEEEINGNGETSMVSPPQFKNMTDP